jgi:hypothetical protein
MTYKINQRKIKRLQEQRERKAKQAHDGLIQDVLDHSRRKSKEDRIFDVHSGDWDSIPAERRLELLTDYYNKLQAVYQGLLDDGFPKGELIMQSGTLQDLRQEIARTRVEMIEIDKPITPAEGRRYGLRDRSGQPIGEIRKR